MQTERRKIEKMRKDHDKAWMGHTMKNTSIAVVDKKEMRSLFLAYDPWVATTEYNRYSRWATDTKKKDNE